MFKYEDLKEKDVIGHGSYGTVITGKLGAETFVAKKLIGESKDDEKCFLKEAKLLNSVKHKNVVLFKAFCSSPLTFLHLKCASVSPIFLTSLTI